MKRSNKYSNTSSVLGSFSESRWRSDCPICVCAHKETAPMAEGRKVFDAHPKRAYNPARCLSFRRFRCSLSRVNEAPVWAWGLWLCIGF